MPTAPKICLAILEARPGAREALKTGLTALLAPTRAEPGCLDYVLFEDLERPGRFIMRESFTDEAAFQAHIATPHFQAFFARADTLLAQPIELVPLALIG